MLNSPDNSSASSRDHHSSANLADRKANSSSLSMKTPMHEVEAEEGVVDVEGVGVEEAMAGMVDTTKVVTIRVVGIMIIKVGMAAMTIKVGMVVDMATTKADMETTKKMVGIAEDEVVVCVEEATGVTVEAMMEAEAEAMKVAGAEAMKEAGVEAMKEAGQGRGGGYDGGRGGGYEGGRGGGYEGGRGGGGRGYGGRGRGRMGGRGRGN
nr:unnamed protein product [Digitaria exilis]